MAVARFWRENASRYNLIGTKCGVCGRAYFPPRSVCPTCHRQSIGKMEPYKLKGFRYSDEIVRKKAGKSAAGAGK